MKSILFLVLCLGLRNISGQPTKASREEPKYSALNRMTILMKVPYNSIFERNAFMSAMMFGSAYVDVHAICVKWFGQSDGDGDGIITHQEYAQSRAKRYDMIQKGGNGEITDALIFEMFASLSANKGLKDMIPIEKACKVMEMMANIPWAQSIEDAIKGFRRFYRYFDENKDGQLSGAEVFFPMNLMNRVGLPIEDLFGKHEESVSVSIEGNYFVIQYCTTTTYFFSLRNSALMNNFKVWSNDDSVWTPYEKRNKDHMDLSRISFSLSPTEALIIQMY